MEYSLRDYYKALYFSGIYSSPHRYGYSGKLAGAMYAIGEVRDAVPVIHGPAGCGFHYKYICRRGYLPEYNAQCTGLKERDIIFGGAGRLRSAILETVRRYAPAMIAVIPAVSVDMIHDEIDNVVDSLRSVAGCRVISVKSEKFSHVDKRNRKSILEQRAKNWDNPHFKKDFDFTGCGFAEAMKAMVENIMETQEVDKVSVNICGLAWGLGGSAIARGVERELNELGIRVNSYIPNCTTREIVKAPAAGLNIISRRTEWAEKMREVFGTEYFHMNSFNFYRGPEGIERFYLQISERLGIRKRIQMLISLKRRNTLEKLNEVREYFKGFRFALYTSSYNDLPYIIEKYEKDLGIPLACVCVDMRREDLELDGISEETRKILIKNIRQALSKTGSRAELLLNASHEVIREALGEADFVIDEDGFNGKPAGIKSLQGVGNVMPMDFMGFEKLVFDLAQRIKKAPPHDSLLIERFQYQPGNYPMLNDPNMAGSRKMWEKMWLQRRCGI